MSGDGLCAGYDSEDRLSQEYEAPYTFTDGTILGVVFDVGDDVYLDLERKPWARSRATRRPGDYEMVG